MHAITSTLLIAVTVELNCMSAASVASELSYARPKYWRRALCQSPFDGKVPPYVYLLRSHMLYLLGGTRLVQSM